MLHSLVGETTGWVLLAGLLFSFVFTFVLLKFAANRLPKDLGRDFAFNGKLSAGKPRGAGLYFVLVFLAAALLFVPIQAEILIYLVLIAAAMLSGYFDDASDKPWSEYKKGLIDLIIAILVAVTYLNFHPSTVTLGLFGISFTLPPVVFGILVVVLVWASINVTNCSDGVDGLSATLTSVTLVTIYFILKKAAPNDAFELLIPLFLMALLAYQWFNATPSLLMMGDAGSRAMGIFIAIAILQTGRPFLYLLVAIVLILDGGLGLAKISLKRFLHISILKNTRTPLHDQARKVDGWSNTQTVFRFAILQSLVSLAVLCLLR